MIRALLTAVGLLALSLSPAAGQQADAGCALCHGELELLRQHVPTLQAARDLMVGVETVLGSAHAELTCTGCHTGFDRFPHRGVTRTESCASCHQEAQNEWSDGIHRVADGEDGAGAGCASCHGVHDVPGGSLEDSTFRARIDASCVSCHPAAALPPSDPHADTTVSCASCHAPHSTRAIDDARSRVAPLNQYDTCGDCHQGPADSARLDTHGRALHALAPPRSVATLRGRADAPPTCSGCHGAHGMRAPSHAGFEQAMVEACGTCHRDYSERYFGTYHGKATALGSEIVATCDDCHGAHSIFPADTTVSLVSDSRLLETCAACHTQADEGFILYDSHPDPLDRERNPPLFYSFVFMNALLFGVLGVFVLHTALWWLRLFLDRRRGVAHGPERQAGPSDEGGARE